MQEHEKTAEMLPWEQVAGASKLENNRRFSSAYALLSDAKSLEAPMD